MESVDPNPCPRRHHQRCQPQNIGFSLALRLVIMGYQGGRLVVCACWEDILSTGRVVGTWRGRAILLMLVSVLVYSLAPLAVSWSGVSERPFLFSALLQAGGMLGYALLLGFAYRPLVLNRKVWSLVVRRLLRWPMLAGSASGFDYALFVWSTRFVDVGVATVLFEVWPLLLVAATGWWFRSEGRFGRITLTMGLLLAGGLVGSALVVVSQGGLASVLPGSGVTLGIVLALGSAVAVALAAGLFRWGADLGVAVAPYAGTRYGPVALEMFGIAAGIVVADLVAMAVNLAVGWAMGETLEWSDVALGLVGGVLVYTVASFAWRLANVLTDDLTVNGLAYLSPLLALGWLLAFWSVSVARLDLLLAGAVVVVSCNLLSSLGVGRGSVPSRDDDRGRLST